MSDEADDGGLSEHYSEERFDRLIEINDDNVKQKSANDHTEWGRSPFEKDVDRIKYSPKVRRLRDVTQVAPSSESYLYHDRLSHSLKVSQVGRRLAQLLKRREAYLTDKANDALIDVELNTGLFSHSLSKGVGQYQIENELSKILDPDIVQAASLAHDMGHPPFGHIAEQKLDELIYSKTHPEKEIGDEVYPNDDDHSAIESDSARSGLRFEGNAQTFRILTRLSVHPSAKHGLGVTRATLNSVLKYPWGRGEWPDPAYNGKFGYYLKDRRAFEFAREQTSVVPRVPSLEAAIMDYADDLSYAVHDVTDFFKAGHIPLVQLTKEANSNDSGTSEVHLEDFISHVGDHTDMEYPGMVTRRLFQIFQGVQESLYQELTADYIGSRDQRKALDEFTSHLITWFLNAENAVNPTRIKVDYDEDWERFRLRFGNIELENGAETTVRELLEVLQELTMHYVVEKPSLLAQQKGQRKIIESLFGTLLEEAERPKGKSALPEGYQDYAAGNHPGVHPDSTEPERNARVVADFISGMTETQALEMYQRLSGYSPGTFENQIIRSF